MENKHDWLFGEINLILFKLLSFADLLLDFWDIFGSLCNEV